MNITPKLLLFYYLLIYESKRRETILSLLNALQNPNNVQSNLAALTTLLNFQNSTSNPSNKLISSSLDALLNFKYPAEIFSYIPINYFLIKAKETDFLILYPALLRYPIFIHNVK